MVKAVPTAALLLLASLAVCSALVGSPPSDIRVVLGDDQMAYTLSGEINWQVNGAGFGKSTGAATIKLENNKVVASFGGGSISGQRITATGTAQSVDFGGKSYRGRLDFFKGKAGYLVALNVLPLEDYLKSVVPSEMPPGWPAEALKAQAVAARTYAISRMAANQAESFDVYATVADQAYGGMANERQTTSSAVEATAGLIATYGGLPIIAYYSSDAGGYTRQGSEPYLQPVPSFVPDSPHNRWSISLDAEKLSQIAKAAGCPAPVTGVSAEYDARTGHLVALKLQGSGGSGSISGNELRTLLGYNTMKSTLARLVADGQELQATAPAPPESPVLSTFVPDASGFEFSSLEMFNWQRPDVLHAEGQDALKLRRLYAYNGRDLQQCKDSFFAFESFEFAPPQVFKSTPHVLPPPAQGNTADPRSFRLTLEGSGYGHGIGMSQWGAKYMAEQGHSYEDILKYFYTGISLATWNGTLPQNLPQGDNSGFYQPFRPSY